MSSPKQLNFKLDLETAELMLCAIYSHREMLQVELTRDGREMSDSMRNEYKADLARAKKLEKRFARFVDQLSRAGLK